MAYDYTTFPRKRVATGCIVRNESGDILIVKPNYLDNWLLPGGVSDEDESPADTASRELEEEIGTRLPIVRMLCIDYVETIEEKLESLQCIALARYRDEPIEICQTELEDWRFVSEQESLSLLGKDQADRMRWAIRAEKENTMFYLENGENPFI